MSVISSLATYTKVTPNKNARTQQVLSIIPHFMADNGAFSGAGCANYFYNMGITGQRQCSSNYCIGGTGDIACSVPEEYRAWTSSSEWADQQAITIEVSCTNNTTGEVTAAAWNSLVALCVDICKRYGIRMEYTGDYHGTLMEHRMFASTNCLPTDTELLTPSGWVKITDVNDGDLIASPHIDDLSITFAPVLGRIPIKRQDVYENHGLQATKDHNIVYRGQSNKHWKLKHFNEVLKDGSTSMQYIPLAGYYSGPGLPLTDEMLRFLIAVQADGHYMRDSRDSKPYGVEFHVSKQRKIDRLKEIIDAVGFDYTECRQSNGTVKIRIYNQGGINIALDICEEYLEDKQFTWKWLDLDKEQAVLFLDEIMIWDGCIAGNKYSSCKHQNLDVVNAVAAINGVGSRVIGSDVCFREQPYNTLSAKTIRLKPKDVCCVTSTTGLILIRQKGKTFIVGNCPGEYLHQNMARLAAEVNAILDEKEKPVIETGWKLEDGKWHYYNDLGVVWSEWVEKDGGKAYLKSNTDAACREWVQIDDAWYYFGADGLLVTSTWISLNGTWYYCKKDGSMAKSEWVWDGTYGAWYYLNARGEMQKSRWIPWRGAWYYVKANGKMASSEWIKDDGKYYYVYGDGHMARSEDVDGHTVNAKGERID